MKPNELNFKMIVPPASVGLFVVASGICLFLFNSLRKGKGELDKGEKKVAVDDSRCACCLKPFIIGRGVQCNDCDARFCRKACGRWEAKDNIWLCLFCYHKRTWLRKRDNWFDTFGGLHSDEAPDNEFSTAKSQVYIAGVEHAAIHPSVDLAAGDSYEEVDSMENIRGIIEKIVEGLVGNVDDTPIDRLYEHPSYDRLFDEFGARLAGSIAHLTLVLRMCIANKPAADTPSMAHTALRELVERAVDEARKLPGLGDSVTTRRQDTSISEQSYEDLLAAAILNKVIEKYQKGRVDGNSNVVRETVSRTCRHRRCGMGANDAVDGASLDPTSQDECSSECSCTKTRLRVHQEPLSLTIEEQIEEVTTTYTSDEEPRNVKTNMLNFRNTRRVPFPEFGMDIVDPSQESSEESEDEADGCASVDHITPLETWEENWLFQKKRIPTQSEPVAMLVPNPSEDYRALIGDKDADDMSDLSEFSAQSDEEVDEDLIEAINRVVPESPEVKQVPARSQRSESVILADNFMSEITRENHDGESRIEAKKPRPAPVMKVEGNKKTEQKKGPENESPIEIIEVNRVENVKTKNAIDNDKVNVIPKTPSSTPTRNSLCESVQPSPVPCDPQKLNEKLISIDKKIDENVVYWAEPVALTAEIKTVKPREKQNVDTSSSKPLETPKKEHSPLTNGKIPTTVPACQETATAAKAESISTTEVKLNDKGLELSAPPRPGTIAEREHKKWENAPPIQNNPYSQESIQKRLLERQYARRSSDVSGNSGVLPTSPSPPLQIVLGANRPDVQRFARDYYINESKSPTGERSRRSGTSNSSRPGSSLSQNSTSTSSDYEHQESFDPIEVLSKSHNNREAEPKEVIEEILERERKNSKNEINAKLNNQGNYDNSTIYDGKKSFVDDSKRKIRRIDLRAYGFENEFDESDESKKKPQRVVNKLDLRSFGYDSGLRRTQSNNQIDSKVNNSFINSKFKNDHIGNKSNITQNRTTRLRPDYSWTQSTETLNESGEAIFDKFGEMKSAKSVPNIAKSSSYAYSANKITSDTDKDTAKRTKQSINGSRVSDKPNGTSNGDSYDSDSQSSRTESTEELSQKFSTLKELKYSLESLEGPDRFVDKKLPMPSVRRLAEAFDKPPEVPPVAAPRVIKPFGSVKDRPTTPEIHIVKTPRQMHSLTARSLPREFREGLRQISYKPNAQPICGTIIEQSKVPAGSAVIDEIETIESTDVIPHGNMKDNIEFWEQLQKKN